MLPYGDQAHHDSLFVSQVRMSPVMLTVNPESSPFDSRAHISYPYCNTDKEPEGSDIQDARPPGAALPSIPKLHFRPAVSLQIGCFNILPHRKNRI